MIYWVANYKLFGMIAYEVIGAAGVTFLLADAVRTFPPGFV
jgi:hypothetical protein